MKRVLTGLKPTGNLTLGNYIGAIKPLIDMQNNEDYEILLFVADLHALTIYQDPTLLKERIKKSPTVRLNTVGDEITLLAVPPRLF